MLVSMNQDGFCMFACEDNLARRAMVRPSSVAKAIKILESPDLKSFDPQHEGRRIERVQGGWMVLNAAKYRAINTQKQLANSTKSPQNSENLLKSQKIVPASPLMSTNRMTEAEAEAEVIKTTTTPSLLQPKVPEPNPSPTPPSPKKRRTRETVIRGYSPQTAKVVRAILDGWPTHQPDKSKIHTDVPDLAAKIDALLLQPGITADNLTDSASAYLEQNKYRIKAPQWFFGAGQGDGAHWLKYARALQFQPEAPEAVPFNA
jgi:hypothetical protein